MVSVYVAFLNDLKRPLNLNFSLRPAQEEFCAAKLPEQSPLNLKDTTLTWSDRY